MPPLNYYGSSKRAKRAEELRAQQGPPLIEVLFGKRPDLILRGGGPGEGPPEWAYEMPTGQPSEEFLRQKAINEAKYGLPQVPSVQPQPPAGPVPSPEDLAALTQKYDVRPPPEGTVPPPPPERMAPLGEMPGKTAPPVMDRYDVLGPQAEEMQRDKTKRLLKGIAASLGQAGAIMASTPSTGDILLGREKPLRPVGKGLAEQMQEEEAAAQAKIEEAKEVESPLLREYNKVHNTNFKTHEEMQKHQKMRAAEVGIAGREEAIKASKAKRAALTQEGLTSVERLKDYAAGKLEAAPPEIKKMILSERQKWRSDVVTKEMEKAINAAGQIDALLDAENSTASRAAVTHMVKVAGDTGRLSDQDIARFEQRMGIKGWGDWLHKMAFSDLSDAQKEEFREIAGEIKEMALEGIQQSALKYTTGISKLYPELNPEELATIFLGQELEATTGKKEKTFWATVKKPIGDYEINEPIEVTEEQFQKYSEYLER